MSLGSSVSKCLSLIFAVWVADLSFIKVVKRVLVWGCDRTLNNFWHSRNYAPALCTSHGTVYTDSHMMETARLRNIRDAHVLALIPLLWSSPQTKAVLAERVHFSLKSSDHTPPLKAVRAGIQVRSQEAKAKTGVTEKRWWLLYALLITHPGPQHECGDSHFKD